MQNSDSESSDHQVPGAFFSEMDENARGFDLLGPRQTRAGRHSFDDWFPLPEDSRPFSVFNSPDQNNTFLYDNFLSQRLQEEEPLVQASNFLQALEDIMRPEEQLQEDAAVRAGAGLGISTQFNKTIPQQITIRNQLISSGLSLFAPSTQYSFKAHQPEVFRTIIKAERVGLQTSGESLVLKRTRTQISSQGRRAESLENHPLVVRVEIGVLPWSEIQRHFISKSRAYVKKTVSEGQVVRKDLGFFGHTIESNEDLHRLRASRLKEFMVEYGRLMGPGRPYEPVKAELFGQRVRVDGNWVRFHHNVGFPENKLALLWATMFKTYLPEAGDPDQLADHLNLPEARRSVDRSRIEFLLEMPIFSFTVSVREEQKPAGPSNIAGLAQSLSQFLLGLPTYFDRVENSLNQRLTNVFSIWVVKFEPIGSFDDEQSDKKVFEGPLSKGGSKLKQKFRFADTFIGLIPGLDFDDEFEEISEYEGVFSGQAVHLFSPGVIKKDPIFILTSLLQELLDFYSQRYNSDMSGELTLTAMGLSLKFVRVEIFKKSRKIYEVSPGFLNHGHRREAIKFLKNFSPKAFEFSVPFGLKQFLVGERSVDSAKFVTDKKTNEIEKRGFSCTTKAFLRYLWVLASVKFEVKVKLGSFVKIMDDESLSKDMKKKVSKHPVLEEMAKIFKFQKDLIPKSWVSFVIENIKWCNWILYKVGVTKEVMEEEPITVLFQENYFEDAPTFVVFEVLTLERASESTGVYKTVHHVELAQCGTYELLMHTLKSFKSAAAFIPEKKKWAENMESTKKEKNFSGIETTGQAVAIENKYLTYFATNYQLKCKTWGRYKKVDEKEEEKKTLKHKKFVEKQQKIVRKIEEDVKAGVEHNKAFFKNVPCVTDFYSWDIETFVTADRQPFCSSVYSAKMGKAVNFWGPECIIQTVQHLFKLAHENEGSIHVWTMNGSRFDFMYILPYLKNVQISGSLTNVKHMCVKVPDSPYRVEFFDIGLTLSGSLNQIAKAFKLDPKTDHNFENFRSWELIEKEKEKIIVYCNHDAELVYQIYLKFREEVNQHFNQEFVPEKFISASSLSFKIWLKHFFSGTPLKGCQKNEYDVIKTSYFGGYTQVLKTSLDSGYYFDINSSYPSVMEENIMPTQLYEVIVGNTLAKQDVLNNLLRDPTYRTKYFDFPDFILLFRLQGFKFVPETMYPSIPLRFVEGNLYFLENEDLDCWAWDHLVDNIFMESPENVLKVSEVWVFKGRKIFDQLIKRIYPLKSTTDRAEIKQFAKLLMNSVYGKTGQREFPDKQLFGPFPAGTSGKDIIRVVSQKSYRYASSLKRVCRDQQKKIGKTKEELLAMAEKERKKKEKREKKGKKEGKSGFRTVNRLITEIKCIKGPDGISVLVDYANTDSTPKHPGSLVFIASYVTSLARLKLFKVLQTCQRANNVVAYADTDSVFTQFPIDERLQDSTKLGYWKLECKVEDARFLGSKMYTYVKKGKPGEPDERVNRCKGIPGEYLKNLNLFTLDTAGESVNIENTWKRGFGSVTGGAMIKKVRPTLNRRYYLEDGTSKPLKNLAEFQALNKL